MRNNTHTLTCNIYPAPWQMLHLDEGNFSTWEVCELFVTQPHWDRSFQELLYSIWLHFCKIKIISIIIKIIYYLHHYVCDNIKTNFHCRTLGLGWNLATVQKIEIINNSLSVLSPIIISTMTWWLKAAICKQVICAQCPPYTLTQTF